MSSIELKIMNTMSHSIGRSSNNYTGFFLAHFINSVELKHKYFATFIHLFDGDERTYSDTDHTTVQMTSSLNDEVENETKTKHTHTHT